jgi:hypothetical protein
MVLIPAAPDPDYGSSVHLDPEVLDLDGFLALAGKLGVAVLYLEATPFTGESPELESDELPDHLARRKGQIGVATVAFPANGLVHFWVQRTPWYREWEHLLAEADGGLYGHGREDDADQLDDEARESLTSEWVQKLLNMPEFRAAKAGARRRVAQLHVPSEVQRQCGWRLIDDACEQAQVMAEQRYDTEIKPRLAELGAELAVTAEWRQVSSAAGRREVAEKFLINHADGYSPPKTVFRDELYGHAKRHATPRHAPLPRCSDQALSTAEAIYAAELRLRPDPGDNVG